MKKREVTTALLIGAGWGVSAGFSYVLWLIVDGQDTAPAVIVGFVMSMVAGTVVVPLLLYGAANSKMERITGPMGFFLVFVFIGLGAALVSGPTLAEIGELWLIGVMVLVLLRTMWSSVYAVARPGFDKSG